MPIIDLIFNSRNYLYSTFKAIWKLLDIHFMMCTFENRIIFMSKQQIIVVTGAMILIFKNYIYNVDNELKAYSFKKFNKSKAVLTPVEFDFSSNKWKAVFNYIEFQLTWLTSERRESLHSFTIQENHDYSLHSQEYRRLTLATQDLNCQYNFSMLLILPKGNYNIFRYPELKQEKISGTDQMLNVPKASVIKSETLDLIALVSPVAL